jgi:hypothetical protein
MLVSLVALYAQTEPARAYIGWPPLYHQVGAADCVVVGKVMAIEEKTVTVRNAPNSDRTTTYWVALVKITDPLWEPLGLTHVRVALMSSSVGVHPVLPVGQEACFMLHRHFEEPFFLVPSWPPNSMVPRGDDDQAFAKGVARLKRYGRLLTNPSAGLQSKDSDERLLTAALLLTRYRGGPVARGATTTQPIDAEQSRLILEALRTADWAKQGGELEGDSPVLLFWRLGLTDKDDWPPAPFKNQKGMYSQEAAKKWLEIHAATYRIQRFVLDDKKSSTTTSP